MSPSPVNAQDQKDVERYTASWAALMQQVRRGSSWSGYERNCSFLNTGGRFVGASHVSGLDFQDDGRGLAVTDWDQDGDLDLWFSNRTAPRLRLMLNQSSRQRPAQHVAFRLVGSECNRDAIGAVVELHLEHSGEPVPRLVRSVRAGDLFLSQSSKWIHFGVPENATVASVSVLWPGGSRSNCSGITAGQRYLLRQGESSARQESGDHPRRVSLNTTPLATVSTSPGQASLVLPAPIRLPLSSYHHPGGSEVALPVAEAARLILFWSAHCPHCREELKHLAANPPGVNVLALCVDGRTKPARDVARSILSGIGSTASWGMVGAAELERLHLLQESLFDSTPPFAVPFSLLVRPDNEIVAIYRGALSLPVLAHDTRHVVPAPDLQLRNLAPPFPGRWFTDPAGPTFLPLLVARRNLARYPEEALLYLQQAAEDSIGSERSDLMTELGRRHYLLADQFATRQLFEKSDHHYEKSLAAVPHNPSVHNDFGASLARRGKLKEGAQHFREALHLKPDFPLARENLTKAEELLKRAGGQ